MYVVTQFYNSQWNIIRTSTLFKSLFSTLSLAVNDSPSFNNFICNDLESSFPASCDYISHCKMYQYKNNIISCLSCNNSTNWGESEQAPCKRSECKFHFPVCLYIIYNYVHTC